MRRLFPTLGDVAEPAATSPRDPRALLHLVLFCVIVLGVGAGAAHLFGRGKESFDARRLAALRARQPEFVLIGDSMLGCAIDPATLENALGGRKVAMLWHGGASSAAWYLYLKNVVVGAHIHPRRIFIWIRDDVLSKPEYRTTGNYMQQLERLMVGDERVFRRLARVKSGPLGWLENGIDFVFPGQDSRPHYQEKLDSNVRRLVARRRLAAQKLRYKANAVFTIRNTRGDQPVVADDEGERRAFDPRPGASFLPHIIALAHEHNFQLCFVRAKKRPGPYADFDDSSEMKAYYSALGFYLARNGCELVDLTHDPAVTADLFSDAVHISNAAMPAFTRHFAEELRDKLQ